MIIDSLVVIWFAYSLAEGFRKGLIKSLLTAAGYIAGGFAALYIVIDGNQTTWAIPAIFIGVAIGSFLGHALDKALKLTIIRGPFAFVNSVAGSAIDAVKVIVAFYVIATVILWSPWTSGHGLIAHSKIYKALDTRFETLSIK